ncbi:hypothetical protein [Burkholderia sp. NLJ2]|uniref:hypothetical protein n=1 Tax=Burkholderia sp. NLJ2 TaxID=3090699 RepID=UPI003C6C340B
MPHGIDRIDDGIAACVETGTAIVHNPSAIMSIMRERVNEVAEAMIERSGLGHLPDEPKTRWAHSHY